MGGTGGGEERFWAETLDGFELDKLADTEVESGEGFVGDVFVKAEVSDDAVGEIVSGK